MKTKQILMSTDMVKAILEGRKTMARRKINGDGESLIKYKYVVASPTYPQTWKGKASEPYTGWCAIFSNHPMAMPRECPYGVPDDILWVRETFGVMDKDTFTPYFVYKADGFIQRPTGWERHCNNPKRIEWIKSWKSSIFMPKAACRIFLKIKSVRVERLNDISEQDAIAEGVKSAACSDEDRKTCISTLCEKECISKGEWYNYPMEFDGEPCEGAVESFEQLWQMINGPKSWNQNPWVWVVEFERCEKPNNFA